MFEKVLIANRGEIALRVIRACKELGLRTVAVFSQVDRDSLHARLADEAICIGNNSSAESYLNIPNIISAAEISRVFNDCSFHSDSSSPARIRWQDRPEQSMALKVSSQLYAFPGGGANPGS